MRDRTLPAGCGRAVAVAGLAGAVVLGASAPSRAALTTWQFGGASLGYYANIEGSPTALLYSTEVVPVTVSAHPIEEGIEIVGTGDGGGAFALSAAQYQPGNTGDPELRGNFLHVFGTGTFDGASWQHPEDLIRSTFALNFGLSDGELNILGVESSFTLRDSENNFLIGVGSSGYGESLDPGEYGVGFAYEDRFGSNYQAAVAFDWAITMRFEWSVERGDSPVLSFGFDRNLTTLEVVPAPGCAACLGLLGAAGLRRRR